MRKQTWNATINAFAILFIAVGIRGVQAGAQQNPAAPPQTTSQAVYFSHGDLETAWNDLEAKHAINKRVVDAGKYSINIRLMREAAAPLVHSHSVDIWIMEGGSAVAVTGGKLVNPERRGKLDELAGTAIEDGSEQIFLPGDILYVPAGVPHGFKDTKHFRAYLIRIDLN